MRCHVYRSAVRDGLYVYVSAPSDDAGATDSNDSQAPPPATAAGDAAGGPIDAALLASLPDPVQRQLGRAERAMTLTLDLSRPLGQEDIAMVLANLEKQGFHIQMPRDIEPLVTAVADEAINTAHARAIDSPTVPGNRFDSST